MKVEVILPESESAWHAARAKDVTASIAGALLNCHSYTTAYQLWAEKSGLIEPDREENEAMRRGRLLEPAAIAMLREERPDWWVEYRNDRAYYRCPDLRIGATPDAFAFRPDGVGPGIVQIKVISEEAFRNGWQDPDNRDVAIPLWIAVQAIVEAKMTHCTWAAVAVMVVGRGIKMHVLDIPLHENVWTALKSAVADFWRIVESGEHPPIEWERDSTAVNAVHRISTAKTIDLTADFDIDVITGRLEDTREERRAAQRIEEVLRAQVLHALGDSEAGETASFIIHAPTTYRADGGTQRMIRIKRKDPSHGAF